MILILLNAFTLLIFKWCYVCLEWYLTLLYKKHALLLARRVHLQIVQLAMQQLIIDF